MRRINNVFIFVGINDDGNEDIPALRNSDGQVIPLICENEEGLAVMSLLAQAICDRDGIELELREYTTYAVVSTIKPQEE